MNRSIIFLLVSLFFGTPLLGETVQTLNGIQKGSLTSWSTASNSKEAKLKLEDGKEILKSEFLNWKVGVVGDPLFPNRIHVRLLNGVGIQAEVEKWDEDSVTIKHQWLGKKTFTFDKIQAILFLDRVKSVPLQKKLWKTINAMKLDSDIIFLENDHVKGLIEAVEGKTIKIERPNGSVMNFALKKVKAVLFANEIDKSINNELILETVDGLILPIKSFKRIKKAKNRASDDFEIITSLGKLTIKRRNIATIKYWPKTRRYLSDIKPSKAEESLPGEKVETHLWHYQVDKSVNFKRGLSSGKRKWEKGIGVHSDSKLTWKLPAGCQTLSGSVAIDNEGLGHGSVHFRIFADGKVLFESGLMTGTTKPKLFRVDLKGKKNLVLQVVTDPDLKDDKEKNYTLDRADWLGLILTLQP